MEDSGSFEAENTRLFTEVAESPEYAAETKVFFYAVE